MKKQILRGSLALCAVVVAVSIMFKSNAYAFSPISSELNVGSTGTDVNTLQSFLAQNPSIYPSGLVTGYYGPLTQAAVTEFQLSYNLDPVGQVGPITLATINSMITAGSTLDLTAPAMSTPEVTVTTDSATVSWTTNETSIGRVYYDVVPIGATESPTPPYVSIGGTAVADTGGVYTHSITLSGLMSHTTYYYFATSTDTWGNVTVSSPHSLAFMTD